MYSFEGLCISLKKKNFKLPDVTFILRNVIMGIGVELTISYFYNRLFNFRISDYKRKSLNYKRTKLFFVRNKLNRASRIKT
jgi:ribosomal protein L19